MRYHLTLKSENRKAGKIPVSVTSSDSCPRTCGQFKTCYAKGGPLAMHWRAVDAGRSGMGLRAFCRAIAALPAGQVWRHNAAGDLPGKNERIDRRALQQIVEANKGRKGWTYSHKWHSEENLAAIRSANEQGFTINLSCDSLAEVDAARAQGLPAVVTLPADVRQNFRTAQNNLVVLCPAATHANVSCATCKLCAWKERQVTVGFPAHGSRAALVQLR
jgi:hypothetical protein